MQTKKAEVEEAILTAAREEFLQRGFKDASIRAITRNAGVARSNVYNYFESKDALFYAVVEPTITEIREAFKRARLFWEKCLRDGKYIGTLEEELAEGKAIVEYIDTHRDDLKLILLKSAGSCVEQFQEEMLEEYQQFYTSYFDYLKTHFSEKMKNEVSPFFIHTLTSSTLNFIIELVSHDIPRDKMMVYMEQTSKFYYYGLTGLMEH